MTCIGCKYYDDSVDCCNADENCYRVGYEQGRADAEAEYESAEIPLIHGKAELEEHDAKVSEDAIEPIKAIIQESEQMMWCADKTLEKIKEQLKEQKDE